MPYERRSAAPCRIMMVPRRPARLVVLAFLTAILAWPDAGMGQERSSIDRLMAMCWQNRDHQLKINACGTALRVLGGFTPLRRAEIQANLAIGYARTNRPEEALDAIDQALASFPDRTDMLSVRGFTLHALGRSGEAMADLERVVELGSTETNVVGQLSDLYLESGQILLAVGVLNDAIDAGNAHPRLLTARVSVLVKRLSCSRCGHP